MPKLKPETLAQRRNHILTVAEACFVRSGFHRTTIDDICREARISAGALYSYFDSKEALIAGLCERDRQEFAQHFSALSKTPDLVGALDRLIERYLIEEPRAKQVLMLEMGAEAARNPRIADITLHMDAYLRQSFTELFEAAIADGRIAPGLPAATVSCLCLAIGDGVFWRRAVDPKYDPRADLPAIRELIARLLQPTPVDPATLNKPRSPKEPRT